MDVPKVHAQVHVPNEDGYVVVTASTTLSCAHNETIPSDTPCAFGVMVKGTLSNPKNNGARTILPAEPTLLNEKKLEVLTVWQALYPTAANVEAGHKVQEVEPCGAVEPDAHDIQEDAFAFVLNDPIGHNVGAIAPSGEKLPGWHSVGTTAPEGQ